MSGLPFIFANPLILAALVTLPAIWWLLRMTPPRPVTEIFPPLRILARVLKREETPAKSPWWLTLLRMVMAAAIILAIADPVVNPRTGTLASSGPLVLVIDNSWSTSADWQRRIDTALALVDDAETADLPVSLTFTAEDTQDAVPVSSATARTRLTAAVPRPLLPDRIKAVEMLQTALDGAAPGTLAYITDGIRVNGTDEVLAALSALSPADLRLIESGGQAAIAITDAANDAEAMTVTASRLAAGEARSVNIAAYDSRGRAIANGAIAFTAGERTARGTLAAPFELRNDFARLDIEGAATAGGAYLLDDGHRRRRVALLSGEVSEFQPLLSPLYYINRALVPYADLIEPGVADLAVAIPELLEQKPSVLVMADIGRLPEETYGPVRQWLENGGTLIRFAGPRLAAAPADDPLVPVRLRQGERALGGALSWSEPQPLADYPDFSPFAGMERPEDILIKRQVLAEPTPDLAERTWASLADGTPLVTTKTVGTGRIILFHVSAEATWSNLPISGDFVEMLRRSVQLARGGSVSSASGGEQAQTLPPYRLLNANGILVGETGSARPLEIAAGQTPVTSFDNPPGLYGTEDGYTALNLLPRSSELTPLDRTGLTAGYVSEPLIGTESWSMKPWLYGLAIALLIADSIIVLFMGGAFTRRRTLRGATIAILLLAASIVVVQPGHTLAQDAKPGDENILDKLNTTHLAYVVTGEEDVDRLSERGLAGLTDFLTYRTTLEPGQPVGLDIAKDELSLYSIIYWPVSASAPMPDAAAVSRIDAYMRNGGTVLFDTRDQFSSLDGTGGESPNTLRLQEILVNLDIPPLEPVPMDHVLTKSFYLLSNFPGRYTGSPLWIEAQLDTREDQPSNRPARSGDGVSPIMITGNDFAGAWAIDQNGVALLPTVPPDELQREHAFRTGVNIMMYMLTGNYKADQVHIPALLERLGQ